MLHCRFTRNVFYAWRTTARNGCVQYRWCGHSQVWATVRNIWNLFVVIVYSVPLIFYIKQSPQAKYTQIVYFFEKIVEKRTLKSQLKYWVFFVYTRYLWYRWRRFISPICMSVCVCVGVCECRLLVHNTWVPASMLLIIVTVPFFFFGNDSFWRSLLCFLSLFSAYFS